MPSWIRCNSCFHPAAANLRLAITSCGHIVCSTCFQKGKQGECLICQTQCELMPLSDKSSAEVKALFSDLSTVASKYFSEISKVLMFQTKHQKRLLEHYQKRNSKQEEYLVKVKDEMQQMSLEMSKQKAYIAKLEAALQQQSSKAAPQLDFFPPSLNSCKPVPAVKQASFMPSGVLSRHSSSHSLIQPMDVESQNLFRKPEGPGNPQRLSLVSPRSDGSMGSAPHRSSSQSSLVSGSFSARPATVREKASEIPRYPQKVPTLQSTLMSYRRELPWETPAMKPASPYVHMSLSSLALPRKISFTGLPTN